jgi:uncharacterized membrane protein YtjA (UPF0391 family)
LHDARANRAPSQARGLPRRHDKALKRHGKNLPAGVARTMREASVGGVWPPSHRQPETFMLYYAVVFLVIALVAALLGFGGIAAGAASIAKILFVVFLIVAIVTFLLSLGRR